MNLSRRRDGYAKAEPIGWAELPEIDEQFFESMAPPSATAQLAPATKTDVGSMGTALPLPKRATAKVDKRPVAVRPDRRTAKGRGQHGIDMTTGAPSQGYKPRLDDGGGRTKRDV